MKGIIFSLVILSATVMSSCSGGDYRDAIPQGSVALIGVNPQKLGDNSKQVGELLQKAFGVEDIKDCGIDLSQRLFLFESADGNFGLCAKVSDSGDVDEKLFGVSQSKGLAKSAGERMGCTFYNLGDSWVAGFTGNTLLIMGPVLPTARAQLMQQMANYLSQADDNGFSKSRLMQDMDSHDDDMVMDIQLNALPNQEELQGLLTLGAPKNADPTMMFISAKLEQSGDIMMIDGKLSSFNKSTDQEIAANYAKLGAITEQYAKSLNDSSVLSFLINGKGGDILPMLQNDKGMMSSMAGINAVIDMNKIIKSINGDMLLQCSSINKEKTSLDVVAMVGDDGFMKDIDYWKESAPAGGKFTQDGQGWLYDNQKDKVNFHFGVLDSQFYCGTLGAKTFINGAAASSDNNVVEAVKGKKIAFVISLAKAFEGKEGLASLLPIFGKAKTIVYTIK